MLLIGVTGPMASGKSDVARRFAERGARVIEGDALGWDVLREPEVRRRIGTLFGPGVLLSNGDVDRRALGSIVFKSRADMDCLNEVVQPRLESRVREAIASASGEGVVVLDAAMLGAWHLGPELDGVLEVLAPAESRIARLAALRGFPVAEARERIEGQILPKVTGARRRWRIVNAGTREELVSQADQVWEEIERLRSEARSG